MFAGRHKTTSFADHPHKTNCPDFSKTYAESPCDTHGDHWTQESMSCRRQPALALTRTSRTSGKGANSRSTTKRQPSGRAGGSRSEAAAPSAYGERKRSSRRFGRCGGFGIRGVLARWGLELVLIRIVRLVER